MERDYSVIRTKLPVDWNSRGNFNRVLLRLDRQSSPGWPLCREASSIGSWLFSDQLEPLPHRADFLWHQVQDVFAGKYDHCYKAFIKAEVHTLRKRDEGRWRIIMASSLPVQVAWHMAVGHLERALVRTCGRQPSSYAQVYTAGGWKRFLHRVRQKRMYWCIDKRGWDWNSPGWVYLVCRELRKRLTTHSTIEWEGVVDNLYRDAYENSRVVLSDGRLLQQLEPGLMKSGLVVTISDNSFAQVALHRAVEFEMKLPPSPIEATGDDTIQRKSPRTGEYLSRLQAFGCVVKEALDGVQFMGFSISDEGMSPMYLGKHLASIVLQKDDFLAETLEAYAGLYVHRPEFFKFWVDLASRLDVSLPSRQYFEYMADNSDAHEQFSHQRPWFADRVVDGVLPAEIA